MRRAFGFCALLGLALCATPAGAAIEEYDTVSPINMTIDSFEYMNTASRDAFTEAMRHWSVAVYEMTNGRHRLGRVKIVQGKGNREFAHVRWLENYHENGKTHAETEAGAYVPYRQEAVSPKHAIKMSSEFLGGRDNFSSDQGPIDTGYTLAHECGHYVYGLFDEYEGDAFNWWPRWIYPNSPRTGDHMVRTIMNSDDIIVHSIMRDQISGFALDGNLFPYERAMALNFSTDEHYGFDGTKCPEEYQTAQRRLYPRTVSCWSTLVSKELPAWALLRSYKRRFYRDLVSAKPATSFDITHGNGFPRIGSTEAEFREKSPAIDDLKIEWGTTDNQRARMILVENSGNLLESLSDLDWPYSPMMCNLVDMLLTAIPAGADVGIFTFDRDGVHEVVPFRKIAEGANEGGALAENAIIRDRLRMEARNKLHTLLFPQDSQTGINIPLYDVLSDAIDRLQAYMDARHILLGDIVVLIAQAPEDSEKYSRETTFKALAAKSRSFFIPLSLVSVRNRSIELYRRLSRETGGSFHKRAAPLSPERFRYTGDILWRSFQPEPYLLRNPWSGYLQLLCADNFGDIFFGYSTLGTSSTRGQSDVQSGVRWRTPNFLTGEAGPPKRDAAQGKRDEEVRGDRIASQPFILDGRIGAFSVFVKVLNPYQRSLQCVLVAPGGKRFPVGDSTFMLDDDLNARVKMDPSLAGYWRLECEGAKYNEAQVSFHIVGESIGLKAGELPDLDNRGNGVGKDGVSVRQEEGGRGYRGALFHHLEAAGVSGGIFNSAENGKRLRLQCSTYEGEELLTGLSVVARVIHPSGWIESIRMRDDGVGPDLADRDGIYTGEVFCNERGHYQVSTAAENDGSAYVTRLSNPDGPSGSFDLEGKSPFWGDAVTEPFKRMDQVTFDVIYDPEAAQAPDPEGTHMTLPILSIGEIEGPQHILEGIETEYSVDVAPVELGGMMAKYFAWSVINSDKFRILPDPEGRPNVVRVLADRDYGSSGGRLQVCNAVPPALIRLVEAQRRTKGLMVVEPVFLGKSFALGDECMVFADEDVFFEGALRLPEGYDSRASWSRRGPDQVARLVRQDAAGCTVRTLKPGTFTLTLSSDVYPDRIGRTITVKVIRREGPGSQPGKPGDDAGSKPRPIPGGDPGGDDDVDTDPGDDGGGGSGGGGPGRPGRPPRGPETPDPEEPVPLPPGVSAVLVDGRALGPGGMALVEGIRSISLAFRFADAVERHLLSASLLSAEGGRNEAEATIDGARLSADGLALTADFHPRTEGRYRIAYGFERKDGVRAKGSFVVKVTGGSGSGGRGDERRGGGCSALDGAAMLFLLACFLLPCRTEGAGDRS